MDKKHYISQEQAKFIQWMIQHLGAGGQEPDWVKMKGRLHGACEATMKLGTYSETGKKTLNRLAESYREEYKKHLADIKSELDSVRLPFDDIRSGYAHKPYNKPNRFA